MSLVTYEEVRPWARSIRQRVANRDMPPWHLDKTVGIRHYKNDRSLNDDEIATIVAVGRRRRAAGQPGRHAAAADVPARSRLVHRRAGSEGDDAERLHDVPERSGLVDRSVRRRPARPRIAGSRRWRSSRATRKIVHHVVVYAIEPDAPEGTPESGVMLHEYAVGKYGDIFGDNTGRLLKKGTRLRFDMHYFAVGSEQHNKTDDRVQVLPEGRHAEISGAVADDPQHPERRARGAAEHRRPAPTATSGCRGRRGSTPSSRTCTCAAAA